MEIKKIWLEAPSKYDTDQVRGALANITYEISDGKHSLTIRGTLREDKDNKELKFPIRLIANNPYDIIIPDPDLKDMLEAAGIKAYKHVIKSMDKLDIDKYYILNKGSAEIFVEIRTYG